MRVWLALFVCMALVRIAHAADHALVIGNANYASLGELRNTHNDAEEFHRVFSELGFSSTLLKDLTLDETWRAIDELAARVLPGDRVSLFYAGHGWSDGIENFISPIDSPRRGSDRQLKRASITLQNGRDGILDELKKAGASLTFAVIDACRNNPFDPLPGRRGAVMSRGLSKMDNLSGSFVIFSAGPNQEALDRLPSDGSDQKLSVFGRSFLPYLEQGMFLEDAIAEAQIKTRQLAISYDGHQQLPVYLDGTAGKTCLGQSCATGAKALIDRSQSAYLEASERGTFQAFEMFLKDHPRSPFATAARQQLSLLRKLKPQSSPSEAALNRPAQGPGNGLGEQSLNSTTGSSAFFVQLSAQRSLYAAHASFADIQRRHSKVLSSLTPDIQKSEIPGRGTYYRVRVRMGSRASASSLCERLKRAGDSCFVSR
ncbi:MAG: caspase family protein [Pseudomonadota bacterium]